MIFILHHAIEGWAGRVDEHFPTNLPIVAENHRQRQDRADFARLFAQDTASTEVGRALFVRSLAQP